MELWIKLKFPNKRAQERFRLSRIPSLNGMNLQLNSVKSVVQVLQSEEDSPVLSESCLISADFGEVETEEISDCCLDNSLDKLVDDELNILFIMYKMYETIKQVIKWTDINNVPATILSL